MDSTDGPNDGASADEYYDGIRTEFFPFIARALAPGESSLVAATSLGPFPQSLWMTSLSQQNQTRPVKSVLRARYPPEVRNPWLDRRPLHYAHQGGACEAPSSTLFAMRQAVNEFGANAIELDVHRSADGHLVVCHDTTVDRTTNASGSIHCLTLAELRDLDPAYWWAPGFDARDDLDAGAYPLRGRFPGDPSLGIATLDEVLHEFSSVFLNFDIKEVGPVRYEAQLADHLRAYGRSTDVIVASFHDDALRTFSEYAPEIHVSLGPSDTFAFYAAVHDGAPMPSWKPSQVALQVPASFDNVDVVTNEFVKGAQTCGLAVHVWTIDDEDEMHRLLVLGVDGVMTDYPSRLAAVLTARARPA